MTEGPATLETQRLRLVPFATGDVEPAFGWLGDPVVMRYFPSGPDSSVDATRTRIDGYREHQLVHGFSKWVIRMRGQAEPIGDSGLLVLPQTGAIDLGFRLARPHWGQGLATEAATAWVRSAFEEHGLTELTAFTHTDNTASIRVLGKAGFSKTGAGRVMGMDAVTFVCRR